MLKSEPLAPDEWVLEEVIAAAFRLAVALYRRGQREESRRVFCVARELHGRRSWQQVRRLERERGIE